MKNSFLKRSTRPLFGFVAILFFQVSMAHACPEQVRVLKTSHLPAELSDLCAAYDRFHSASQILESKGVVPADRIANLLAPRFINMPDWISKGAKAHYSPWYVYDPAPTTWAGWEKGAEVIEREANENYKNQSIPALTLDWLKELNATALSGLLETAGKFRLSIELGKALDHGYALTEKQVKDFRNAIRQELPFLAWHPTQCIEDRTPAFVEQFKFQHVLDISQWPDINPDEFFTMPDGQKKQCGYIVYPAPEEVGPQINKWLSDVNQATATWKVGASPANMADPLAVAARAQRDFVAIHPYDKGNGRVSRFVMEWILKSLGLPLPIIKEMNEDLYHSEAQWADEMGESILRSIKVIESCAADSSQPGCSVVPTTPPPR